MKKIKTLGLLMLTAALLLAGCGKESSNPEDKLTEAEKNWGSIESGFDAYIGDVLESYDEMSFLINVVSQVNEDIEEPRFIGQMFFALSEDNKDFAKEMKPGTVIRMSMKDGKVHNLSVATEDEIAVMEEIRGYASDYEDNIEYIKNLPASEINVYANSVFATWTYEQIEMYQAEIAKMLEDEEFAAEFNAQEVESKVLTAEQRAEDYKHNKTKYEPWRADEEVISSTDEPRDLETLTEFDINESYTEEEINHLIEIGAIIVNEDETWSYPDGTPIEFDSARELTPEQQAIVDEYNELFGDDVDVQEEVEESPEE